MADETKRGFSLIAILSKGISSFVCDIDEKILKQKKNSKKRIIFIFLSIKVNNLTYEK